jgi:hypothetical protein
MLVSHPPSRAHAPKYPASAVCAMRGFAAALAAKRA